MNALSYFILALGIAILVFGILTFTGRTPLSNRTFFFRGIQLDKSVIGIALFFLGMLMIITFLIQMIGPHFTEEGL